jgi:hypothetical protein
MLPSLQDIAIKTIIKNDIAIQGQYYLERLVVEFCENHPDQLDSPKSYWKLYGSYKFLSERKVECKYKGPSDLFSDTFLDDPTNLTTKFINSEMNKYVDLNECQFVARVLNIDVVPYQAYFEFSPKYIKHTGTRYEELGLETTIISSTIVRKNNTTKFLPKALAYHFKNYVYADYIYKYKPITYICENEKVLSVLRSLSAFAAHKNRPAFLFNTDLKFVDECVELQRDCQDILSRVLERIKWFRTTIHATYMSELHFMLLDCDVTHRVLNIMTLYPRVIFRDDDFKDESPDEVHSDEA